jgi:asparagine synthase (glutamine-hydrolysing)
MCGVAGVIDLSGQREVPLGMLRAMADAIVHRGPDEDGFYDRPALGLASRRLSVIGLADGRQPLFNEDRSIAVVYNGELFDYPEMKAALEGRGHRFTTHCDTELLPHLWEDHQEAMFERLRGQFAVALWDEKRRRLVLGRDRFGICPLYWTRQGDWLLFASEIKALLATGLVKLRTDPRGIHHLFTFFALPGPVTCFEGISALAPGHFLSVQLGRAGEAARIEDRAFWEFDFPDRGQEIDAADPQTLVDELEQRLIRAVDKRLRADVPVVSYLSGGVDSSMVVALAGKVRGEPIPTFTIRIDDPDLDETKEAMLSARHHGTEPIFVNCGDREVLDNYPRLIAAAEGPVMDTSCTALLLLAEEVHRRGYKVALTGEGSDEWLAGYPWYKVNRVLGWLDVFPGLPLGQWLRLGLLRATGSPVYDRPAIRRVRQAVGGDNAWLDIYGLVGLSKLRFFSPALLEQLGDHLPYDDLGLPSEKMRRWHPINRGVYFGGRVHLPGLLLQAKGDRVAMHSSVETRYPFLDEDVVDYLATLHPRWKLRGLKDKYLLRLLAERYLPRRIARRPKVMFRAPFDSFHGPHAPAYVGQLLSPESLARTGYFDAAAVAHWREAYRLMRPGSPQRISVEMGLVGVLATQLWHQTFIDSSLADIRSEARSPEPAARTWAEPRAVIAS